MTAAFTAVAIGAASRDNTRRASRSAVRNSPAVAK